MADRASPEDVPELIEFISSYVHREFDKTGRRTTGAALAEAIRHEFPEFTYEQLGLARLADAVHLAEEAGRVVRHRDVKHLEVSPSESTPRSASAVSGSISSYVRPDIWRAFVFVTDRYARFLDRTTGRLIALTSDNAAEIQANQAAQGVIQINPIAPEMQRDWMRQFVESRESLDVEHAPINEEQWWSAFPAWLEAQDPESTLAWRRFRADRVVAFVKKWAEENDISAAMLFSPRRTLVSSRTERACRPAEEEATRRAVIAAIEEMPFEQLQDLPVPVRYMLRHFQAR